ncbi:MAG TPA: glycosyltransferase family 39 protein [Tepidisphaeraceae bacterium]|nr:glycosyltransferase family 39 protein [Tepidisphaeraceae bacterium]
MLVGLVMLIRSWGTWPDCIVDFGRELYTPWQITQGKILYRDIISYFNGPFSPYLHALIFHFFGVSLQTLVVFNLFVIALLITLLFRLISRAWGRIAAASCGISFFVLFAFAQYGIAGNYNYVCPYSYELPHGIALTVASMSCMMRWHDSARRGWLAAAGALLGLIFLTKAEVFLAASVALICGVLIEFRIRRLEWKLIATHIALFVACAIAMVTIAFMLLTTALSPREAFHGLAGSWAWIGDSELANLPFFKKLAGTDDIIASIKTIGACSLVYVVLFGVPALVGSRFKSNKWLGVGLFTMLFIVGMWFSQQIDWLNMVRAMPLVLVIALIVMAVRRSPADFLPAMLIVWALVLLVKMRLNVHITHYGFALAMPTTLIGIALLVSWLPAFLDRSGGNGTLLRSAALAALAVVLIVHAKMEGALWSDKTIKVGAGGDQFYSDLRGIVVNRAVADLIQTGTPGETLAVVPEGSIINYLARMPNPTSQLQFTPPALLMYGEDAMLSGFQRHPPDFLILTGVDTSEYGPRFFGDDYARKLGAWLQENYLVIETIGSRPFKEPGFGMVLFKRKP